MSEALIRLRSRAGDPRRGRIVAFPPLVCGDTDPVTGLPDMRGWAAVTEGPCTELALAGGHDAVVAHADRVRAWVPTSRRGRSL